MRSRCFSFPQVNIVASETPESLAAVTSGPRALFGAKGEGTLKQPRSIKKCLPLFFALCIVAAHCLLSVRPLQAFYTAWDTPQRLRRTVDWSAESHSRKASHIVHSSGMKSPIPS